MFASNRAKLWKILPTGGGRQQHQRYEEWRDFTDCCCDTRDRELEE